MAAGSSTTLTPTRSPLGWPVAHVAARVGVSISTLRSWERRYGLGPSGRTDGGHRRYTTDDIAAMLRLRRFVADGMSTAAAAAAVRGGHGERGGTAVADPLEQQFLTAAEVLDAPGVAAATRSLLVERGAVSAYTDVVMPFLRRVGADFETTGNGIEFEHVAVSGVVAAFDRWTWEHRTAGTPTSVVLAAMEGEQHTLPLHALAAALAERGITSCVLGSLPDRALEAAVTRLGGAHLLRSMVLWAFREVDDAAALRRAKTVGVDVFVAGPGWSGRLPREAVRLRTLEDAVTALAAPRT